MLFSSQDVIVYRILLSHYINNQVNGIATITLDEINLLKHSEEIKDINLYRTLYEIICTNGFKNYIRNIRSQNKRAGD